MNIENINPNDVILYEKNAKYHPKSQVDQIAESLKRFGFRQPVVIDKDNVVVVGHGRVLAARQLGMESVPCERADDLTPEQIRAYRLADNRLNESKWRERALKFELLELSPFVDLSGFGFEMPDFGLDDDNEDADPVGNDTDYRDNPASYGAVAIAGFNNQAAREYDREDFSDEQFECQCPECGFRFNP